MAVKVVSLLLLLDLAWFIQDVRALCNVTCTTDYESRLNCSCSDAVPNYPIEIEAICSDPDDVDGEEISRRCGIVPEEPWCLIEVDPEDFGMIASTETICTGKVNQQGSESTSWKLCDMVKPSQPFNLQVTNNDRSFNITWDVNNFINHRPRCLTYMVRLRMDQTIAKDSEYPIMDQKYIVINSETLQPHTKYIVDVKASLCPEDFLQGPWSEWSFPTEWRTLESAEIEGNCSPRGYISIVIAISISISIAISFLVLFYFQKPFWLKKIQMLTYIPKADSFFTYDGDFKDWVKPYFSEIDIQMINTPVELEKPQGVPDWNTEKESFIEDKEKYPCDFYNDSFPLNSTSLLHFHDGSSWQGTGHSTGHISIHTVTLSGKEAFEESVSGGSTNTFRTYHVGAGFSPCPEDKKECAESKEHIESESISLDSFISNEQSEDGYPCVDLDTIDSGFGESECSSSVNAETNAEGRMDSNVFNKQENSNYVRQWMICGTSDSGNELPKPI